MPNEETELKPQDQPVREMTTQEKLLAPMEYHWRVKSFYAKGVDKKDLKAGRLPQGTKGQFLAYIDARDVYDRLDAVLGAGGWQDMCEPIAGTPAVKVTILADIDGQKVSKEDVGYPNSSMDEEPLKSAVSDGTKRAAVHFGIGRFLYSLEPVWVEVDTWGKPPQPISGSTKSTSHQTDTNDTKPASRASTAPRKSASKAPVENGDGTVTDPTSGQVYEDGVCDICGSQVKAKSVYYSNDKYGKTLCWDHQQQAFEGTLEDPKENGRGQTTQEAVEDLDSELDSLFASEEVK